MFSIIAAILFGVVIVIDILLVMGFPLGEFTMGGQYKVLPPMLRVVAGLSVAIAIFGVVVVLQAGRHIPLLFSEKITQIICYIFAGYFVLNTFMCFFSNSKKEKLLVPVALLAAICFGITAFQM